MAPLDSKTVQIPFGQGLAEDAVPAIVAPGKLHVAEQATIDKTGSIQQRPGTDSLPLDIYEFGGGTHALTAGRHLIADGRGTLMTSPARLYSYQETDGNWRNMDNAYEMDIRRVVQGDRGGKATLAPEFIADVAYAADWIIYAWIDNTANRAYVRFIDYETESQVEECYWEYTSAYPGIRIVPIGGYIYVVWHDRASNGIKAAQWLAADIEAGFSQNTIGADASTGGQFDAIEGNGYLWLVYHYDDRGTDGSMVCRFDDDLANPITALESFLSGAHVVNRGYGIDVGSVPPAVYVAYDTYDPLTAANNQIQGFVRVAADLTSTLTPTLVRDLGGTAVGVDRISTVVDSVSTTARQWVAWSEARTAAARRLNGAWLEDDGTVTDGHKTFHVGMLSRPWMDSSGTIYVVGFVFEQDTVTYGTTTTSVTQNNAYVLEMTLGTKTELAQ